MAGLCRFQPHRLVEAGRLGCCSPGVADRHTDGHPPYTEIMSAQREELLRLVEELPEEKVPAVLDDVRRHLRAVKNRSWPPAWFGAGKGRTTDVAARSEELLEDGFGRQA